MRPLILASASPARLRLLRSAGFRPAVVVSNVDEDSVVGDTVVIVQELARRKADVVAAARPDAIVIGCDSLLELDGEPLGKPATAGEAVARWRRMRGRTGTLRTGHCLRVDEREVIGVASTTVRFGTPSDAEIEAYVATGEPLGVAGAFTLDGMSAPFVDGVDGDPSNVVGLSLPMFRRLLAEAGIDMVTLWAS